MKRTGSGAAGPARTTAGQTTDVASPGLPDCGDVWAPVYDELYAGRNDVEPIVALLSSLGSGRSILEFGIGTGRIAAALVQAGWAVSGIEQSSMLKAMLSRPEAPRLDVHQGDFTHLQLDAIFDIVLLNFNTLFLLRSQDGQLKCFENAAICGPRGASW